MYATYKAFVAETAAKVAAEISKQFVTSQDVSKLTDDDTQECIALAAIGIADGLAAELDKWWDLRGDSVTVFFDPEDTLNSGVENRLADIAEKLDSLERIAKLNWKEL